MINGTYEEGVRDTLKFLEDNKKIEMIDIPMNQFILLLSQLANRGEKKS